MCQKYLHFWYRYYRVIRTKSRSWHISVWISSVSWAPQPPAASGSRVGNARLCEILCPYLLLALPSLTLFWPHWPFCGPSDKLGISCSRSFYLGRFFPDSPAAESYFLWACDQIPPLRCPLRTHTFVGASCIPTLRCFLPSAITT